MGAGLTAGFWAAFSSSSSSELESYSEESPPAAEAFAGAAFTGATLAAGFLASSSSELDSGSKLRKTKCVALQGRPGRGGTLGSERSPELPELESAFFVAALGAPGCPAALFTGAGFAAYLRAFI